MKTWLLTINWQGEGNSFEYRFTDKPQEEQLNGVVRYSGTRLRAYYDHRGLRPKLARVEEGGYLEVLIPLAGPVNWYIEEQELQEPEAE